MLFHRHLGHHMAQFANLPLAFKLPLSLMPAFTPDDQPKQISKGQKKKKPKDR